MLKGIYKMQCRPYNLTNRAIVRNSGIELLKILGIFLIVISHVTQTLSSENLFISYQDYILDLSIATTNMQQLILSILRYSGVIGNTIFFVCSAWFLIDGKKFSGKKWFFMLTEVWVVSAAILTITYIVCSGNINTKMIIKCLMPTTFANNWYMTCYLLFYPIHTILNQIIKGMSQIRLFRSSIVLVVLYMGFDFIKGDLFFPSPIILWIAIYFAVAYIKIYLPDISSNKKVNIILLSFGMAGHLGIILLTNFLGLKINFFSDKLLRWSSNCNPFIIFSVIALLNIARSVNFENRFINHISRLSLIIYIMHENIILRTYYRPYVINYIYENYGYNHILLWVLLLSVVIFVGSAIISIIYEITLRQIVNRLSQKLYGICSVVWQKFEIFALKIH